MIRRFPTKLAVIVALSLTAACSIKKEESTEGSEAASDTVPTEAATPVPQGDGPFSVESVPVSTATLPPFPFFEIPDGLITTLADKERNIAFDGQYFMVRDKPTLVEGKIHRERFSLTTEERPYTELEFHRNYENAIKALGGVKLDNSQYTPDVINAAGGADVLNKYMHGANAAPAYRHDTYLIRTSGKEYWIEISTGSFPLHGFVVVLEKQAMAQSVGFLDASQMKKELDRAGRVALYVNFDTGKATLRPDANPTLAEIDKLLKQDARLKLSIEGHTDNTGNAQLNRDLSTARARSVLGALVGLGIDPARLASKGFGPDKPLADNATEDGRAKNRRVELVKQ